MAVPYLTGHFIYNMWGAPNQDNQSMIRPDRVTPFGGARNYIYFFDESYHLPIKQQRFHGYVLGQVTEQIPNLKYFMWCEKSKWINMADWCKESLVVFQFYTVKGLMIPLNHIWFTLTVENNLVIVIKEDLKLDWDMNSEHITFRTYRNALFNTPQPNQPKEVIDVFYLKVLRSSQRQELNDFYRKYERSPGKIFTYVNGFIVKDPMTASILENDVVEMVYDSTITKVIEMKIRQLPTFQSIKDGIRKYLFTHDKTYKSNLFEYFDDCDFYLSIYNQKTPKIYKGVLLHRNDITNVRQVTNCDFSISTNLVKEMIADHDFIDQQLGEVVIQVYYRKQYAEKVFPFNAHRLHELNKLPFANRIAAMVGLRSNIPEWRADVLENSELMNLVSLDKPICDLERVQEVYGYNAATWYTGKSVHPIKDFYDNGLGGKEMKIPYAFRYLSTVFEYDEKGKLISYKPINNTRYYNVKDKNTKYVEFIGGTGRLYPGHYFGNGTHPYRTYNTPHEVRVYACDENLIYSDWDGEKWRGRGRINTWEDVTDKVMLVKEENTDTVDYSIHAKYAKPSDPEPMYETTNKKFVIRTNKYFLLQELNIDVRKNVLTFTINEDYWDYDNSRDTASPLFFPYGFFDVFLNGHALIENVDFFVDFPVVTIVNKSCIDQSKLSQNIVYRAYGFPEPIQNKEGITYLSGVRTNRQVGYVNNSMLSRNGVWDILDDKNLTIKIGNGIIAKEDLGFSENGTIIPNTRTAELEGKPYEIMDVYSYKRDSYPKNSFEFRKEAEDLDKRISEYMSQFFSDTVFPSNPPIQGLYKIYSPLLSRLIFDLAHNQVKFPKMDSTYQDSELIKYMDFYYREFFDVDPYFHLDEISMKHVTIHPVYKDSITTLSHEKVRFLRNVIRIYYRNEIEISHFIRIGA